MLRGALLVLLLALPVAIPSGPSQPAPLGLLVGLAPGSSVVQGSLLAGARVTSFDGALGLAAVQAGDLDALLGLARSDARIRFVEPDARAHATAMPNDPLAASQWAIGASGLDRAWDLTTGSASARVCVADSGIRAGHEDLSAPAAAHDFVEGDADPQDENGHGTHVASIALARANNARGIAGASQSTLLVARVLGADGSGSYGAIASAIRWCADQGAHVVSLSLSGSASSIALNDAIAYAKAKGALVVAAAGNDGPCTSCVGWPAKHADVLAVGCTTSASLACTFTSSGPEVDLAAPGASILAAWHEGDAAYQTLSGTSMSAPLVAGVAALLKSREPALDAASIRARLLGATRDVGPAGRDDATGAGIVDAGRALAPPAFSATFTGVKGNEWWVEAKVAGSEPIAGVRARVGAGAWQTLTLRSWGAWAASFKIPSGSLVQLEARSASGATATSGCYQWPSATVVACSSPAPSFDATFSNVKGNGWWVEAKVVATGGTLAKVDANVNGGTWKPLALKSWGSWAASFPIPSGALVRLRATSGSGAVDSSGCYVWPAATPASCP